MASADVALIIQEAAGGAGEFAGSGHSAVYFSGLCAETPVKLRPCRNGEPGAVVSSYPDWGQKVPYRWLATPFNFFLYGVENENDIPLYANGKLRRMLREEYRRKYLRDIIHDMPDNSMPDGRWSEVIGATFNRDVYALTVRTTPEQDAKFLETFSRIPNTYQFNTVYDNCADFARQTIDLMFPHAAHRDVLNDFGMTTPKALARSFTRYASARPELLFRIDKYPQIDGAIRRSFNVRNLTEKALVSKKYYLTIAATDPLLYGGFGLSYFLTGYYELDGEYRKVPSLHIAQLRLEEKRYPSPAEVSAAQSRIRTLEEKLLGTEALWNDYRSQFKPILSQAMERHLFLDKAELDTFFKDLEIQSEPSRDSKGGLILRVDDRGVTRTLGISRANIADPESDCALASKLMIAKVNYVLSAPERNRVSAPEFAGEWSLMRSLASKGDFSDGQGNDRRFRQKKEVVSQSKRAQKALVVITH